MHHRGFRLHHQFGSGGGELSPCEINRVSVRSGDTLPVCAVFGFMIVCSICSPSLHTLRLSPQGPASGPNGGRRPGAAVSKSHEITIRRDDTIFLEDGAWAWPKAKAMRRFEEPLGPSLLAELYMCQKNTGSELHSVARSTSASCHTRTLCKAYGLPSFAKSSSWWAHIRLRFLRIHWAGSRARKRLGSG